MTRSRTRSALAALAAGAVLFTAGCGVSATDDAASKGGGQVITGGGGGATGSAGYLSQAAEATGDVKTSKMSMEVSVDGMPGGSMTLAAEGAFDNEAGRGRMSMDMGAMFESMGAEEGDVPEGAGTMEMVIDGDTVYLRSSLFSMLDEDDAKPWKKVDASDLAGSGAGTTGLGMTGTSDPSAFLDFLEGAGEVEELGTEDVRGVSTKHVKAEIDLAKLLEQADGDKKDAMEQQLESLGADLDSFPTLPTEAWIDEDGYVRKFSMTFDLGQVLENTEGAEDLGMGDLAMTMTYELYDFDEPVDIELPPADQVGEMDPSILSGGN